MAAETKSLAELGLTAQSGREVRITGLSVDSRQVKPGHLFAALPGSKVHGGEFIQYALRMEAGAILTDREGAEIAKAELAGSQAALVVAEEPRQALAYAAALSDSQPPSNNALDLAIEIRDEPHHLEVRGARFQLFGGDAVLLSFHDVTERENVERKLRQLSAVEIGRASCRERV